MSESTSAWIHDRFLDIHQRNDARQRGISRAFTYAVGVGNGIKVGKSGTGNSELLKQLNTRFASYSCTSSVEVIAIGDRPLRDIDAEEQKLLKLLQPFQLSFGQEMFRDCREVRNLLWKHFQADWHQDRSLPTLKERKDYWTATGNFPLQGLRGKAHTHVFGWRDYVRLIDEIDLLNIFWSLEEDLLDEDDRPLKDELSALEYFLPTSQALYPRARNELNSYLAS